MGTIEYDYYQAEIPWSIRLLAVLFGQKMMQVEPDSETTVSYFYKGHEVIETYHFYFYN